MDLSSAKMARMQAQRCQILLVQQDALEWGKMVLALKSDP